MTGGFIVVATAMVKTVYLGSYQSDADMRITIVLYLTPAVLSLCIMIPLLVTLCKLRDYHKTYGMQINMKKVVVHLSVCILIFLYYILRFISM